MREILSLGRYFQARFGARVRKIPISLQGFTCPNIDGTLAKGGCIYCKNESFSPSLIKIQNLPATITMRKNLAQNPLLQAQLSQLEEQFLWHAEFNERKFGVQKFMVYFQSYTNTYAPISTLQALYDKALSFEGVVGMSIGTRIDCVDEAVLDLLGGYVKKGYEIWLEYGIQSVYEKTLTLINRAHSVPISSAKALFAATRARGIKVCAHLIYGLPGESEEMMLHSLESTLGFGVDGLKLHPLYVMRDTQLARMYEAGRYEPIDLESYVELIVKSLRAIPESIVLHRISSGAHSGDLLAPKWCFDKNIQMRLLRERLLEEGMVY
ncbi:TIGR01212 family radical SAM protein [Helicobacter sp. CLO-3]|uniref:TIGR01212 family radical SAM protein n=1 Tax=unclassified Helicobacter TaxID=2593540 RepID=UPI0008049DB3|nr:MULTISPECIES: TIGR01212 family radical SAM protein [unclassified Helicobacter]OBV28753.1 TIGR01212 family radical SAM protein [Helicobacter sp. CLO-3]OHU81857.1 TIGR01212 family radical SAM protein [Helicobacter sp. CLO-3]